jgi:ubiquinone/menaquinone biosynthesis C-methylase UbiE
MSIQSSLREFYDAQAEKYHHTRNKHRADADNILDEIKKSDKKTIKILEFGCGSGRLLAHLSELTWIKIHYTWVDISKELLKFAKKTVSGKSAPKHISAEFVCEDIIKYIKSCTQESFDFVLGIASFQHIPNKKERFFLIKNIYRILKYDGTLIMTNRSFSRRFLKKYKKEILRSLWKYISGFWKQRDWNDLMIPRKHGKTISKRFYHIFTLKELQKFLTMSGFIIDRLAYLHKGKLVDSWKKSQNSLVIASKSIFLKTT